MFTAKKMAFTVMSGVLALALAVGGTTYAIFTSSASNSGNTITAGTINLDAKRDNGDYVPGPMFYPDALDPDGNHPYDVSQIAPSGEALGGWAPGDKVTRTMILTNTGSLDAMVTGIKATPRATYTQNLPSGGNRTVNGLTSGAEFDEFVQLAHVKVWNPDGAGTILYDGQLKDLIAAGQFYVPVLNELVLTGVKPPFQPGPLNINFEVTLDKSASNALQGKNFIFDFGFFAEQVRNNNGVKLNPDQEVQVYLTWNSGTYHDLDSHLTGPDTNGNRFHVYWANQNYSDQNVTASTNDQAGFNATETSLTTIKNPINGTFRYSVHHYDDVPTSTSLVSSNAVIKIYQGGNLLATFNAPSGVGNVWKAFEIQNGKIIPVNTLYGVGQYNSSAVH